MDSRIVMSCDPLEKITAGLPDSVKLDARAEQVCPFVDNNPNEDEISKQLFEDPEVSEDEEIGRYLSTYAGWVQEGDFREQGSSGGIGTWLQHELLSRGVVDHVINVTQAPKDAKEALFSFTISSQPDQVKRNAKTRYYPVEMSSVIRHIADNPGRYALIGVPCFIKAARLVARVDKNVKDRLLFTIGIVCGHFKSKAFAKSLAWQSGIHPDEIEEIDFRVKLEGRLASRYGVKVTGRKLSTDTVCTVTKPMDEMLGANWGHGFFKYKACEFCDDVLAETADAVVGDAWLPAYDSDHRGTNILIVRNQRLNRIISDAQSEQRLHLEPLSSAEVAASQAGGLRHRRDGLKYRLWAVDQTGDWRPRKRFDATRRSLTPAMRRIHRMRYQLAQQSHVEFLEAQRREDYSYFERQMSPLISKYQDALKPSLVRRLMNRLESQFDRLLFDLGWRQ